MMTGEHPFEQVRKFMLAGDQDVTGQNIKQAGLYLDLIEEEIKEFWDAYNVSDDIEMLDAICDVTWVLGGYAHSRGWNIMGAFEEVARSNMSKVDKTSGKLLKRADGKVLKSDTYSPPNLAPFIKTVADEPKAEHMIMGLGEE